MAGDKNRVYVVLYFRNHTIATRIPVFSGTDYLSGWITAFCFWDAEGKAKFRRNEVFADVLYPNVDIDEVSVGFAAVPVKVDDNGDVFQATMLAGSVGIQASTPNNRNGQEGAREVSSNLNQSESQQEPEAVGSSTCNNTIQPLSGWWIYENEAPEAAQARESEKKTIEDELRQRSSERRSNMFEESDEDRNNFWSLYQRLEELESY